MSDNIKLGSGVCQGCIGNTFFRFNIIDIEKPLVVTFQNHGTPLARKDVGNPKSYIWGYSFIVGLKDFNVLSFSCIDKDNWYRDDFFINAISIISPLLEVFPKRFGYGSSMGGYAVGAFSDILGLDEILLMNPISTLKKSLAPWEDRFDDGLSFNWENNFNDGARTKAKGYVVFDPIYNKDLQHARRFKSLIQLRVPGVGHAMPAHLKNLGVLKDVVIGFLNGNINQRAFFRKIRRRRWYFGYYRWLLSIENERLTPKRIKVIEKYERALKAFHQKDTVPGNIIDTLRDAALKLENIDLDIAIKCMELAQQHRPNGPLINNKLKEYTKKKVNNG